MYIAVEGCSHGELDTIYESIRQCELSEGVKVDLLICCGDFQSVRNVEDLRCMAVPVKYMKMQSFYKYYSGEAVAPVLTVFIGGNHEASNYLQELPYGGWVAPNIYYLGYGGVVNIGGLRIGGVSGIYKGHDFLKGRYECPPYSNDTVRSVYHVRNLESFRVKQLTSTRDRPVDIFLSHDWPRGVTNFGDSDELCRKKKFFREEVQSNTLGSRAAQEVLASIRPRYWFSGHLHVKFAALVEHEDEGDTKKDALKYTRFLALDKCLGNRDFLQILNAQPNCRSVVKGEKDEMKIKITDDYLVESYDKDGNLNIYHDLEWLTILRLTNHLTKVTPNYCYLPGPTSSSEERFDFNPTDEELLETLQMMNKDLLIKPEDFVRTAKAFNPQSDSFRLNNMNIISYPQAVINPYTVQLCQKLSLDDPVFSILNKGRSNNSIVQTPKRSPTSSEMNVTLDKSLSETFTENKGCDDFDVSSGDIVFEVSISSDSNGAAVGVLNAANDSQTRRSLKLSAPVHCSLDDSQSSSQASSGEEKTSTDDSVKEFSSLEDSEKETPSLEDSMKESSSLDDSKDLSAIVQSVVLDGSVKSSGPSQESFTSMAVDASQDSSANTSQDSTSSPKRLLCEDDADVVQDKPKKIRRRNQSLYSNPPDEE